MDARKKRGRAASGCAQPHPTSRGARGRRNTTARRLAASEGAAIEIRFVVIRKEQEAGNGWEQMKNRSYGSSNPGPRSIGWRVPADVRSRRALAELCPELPHALFCMQRTGRAGCRAMRVGGAMRMH